MDQLISANLVDLCAVLMLLTSVMAVATTRMKPLITLFSLQSVFLAAEAFIVAYTSGESHIYIMCALTLVLKVVVMPRMLLYIMGKIHVDKEVDLSIGIPGSLLASGFMIFVSYYIAEPLISTMETVERSCLAISLSIILIGLLMMCTRRKAITETIGLDQSLGLVQSPATQEGMRFYFFLAPTAFFAASALGLLFLRVTPEKMKQIRAELKERRAAAANKEG